MHIKDLEDGQRAMWFEVSEETSQGQIHIIRRIPARLINGKTIPHMEGKIPVFLEQTLTADTQRRYKWQILEAPADSTITVYPLADPNMLQPQNKEEQHISSKAI